MRVETPSRLLHPRHRTGFLPGLLSALTMPSPARTPLLPLVAVLISIAAAGATAATPARASAQVTQGSAAQSVASKAILAVDDYPRWRTITSSGLSNDGAWATFSYRKTNTFDPEGVLHVKSLTDTREYEIPNGTAPSFSDDTRWVAYFLDLPFGEAEKLRSDGEPVPRKVQLLDLETGKRTTWDDVESFQFSRAPFLAVKMTKSPSQADHEGTDLVLRDLNASTERLLGSVAEFAFNPSEAGADDGAPSLLAHTVGAANGAGNGVYLTNLETGAQWALENDSLPYSGLTWHEDGDALAVLKGETPEGMAEPENVLLAFTGLGTEPGSSRHYELDPGTAEDFPDGNVISERGALSWSEDRSRVFFGIKENLRAVEEPEHPDRIANVDVWHWADERVQSVQMAQARRDLNFTYRSSFLLEEETFVPLTDETMRTIALTQDGRWGIGEDRRAYIHDWREEQADYYRVNTETGERVLILEGQKRTLGLAPDGRNFLFWKDGHVWLYDMAANASRNLTTDASLSFVDAEYDHPGTPPSYGVAGWSKDGTAVILNHRYDLWLQPLDGSPARNLTAGLGAEREIRFRYVRTDPDQETIDLSRPLLLSAYGQWTKKAGYYRLEDGEMEPLVFEDRRFGNLEKAKDADIFLYSRESFVEFPDLHVSGGDFAAARQITIANPWQGEYRWGRRILFDFTNDDGIRLQGTLAIPDDYVQGERRPMLVNFYEKNSQNLHRHVLPRYVGSLNNLMIEAVSKGYLVMQPDIHFRTGNTHADMLECVEAAVRKVIEMGYADPERIGLHGHSFSGQGSSYIAGNSRMFAAVAAGAGVTNLLSDFNHLWGWTPTNMNGAGQTAHRYAYYGQGRFGTNPYDDYELFRRESPSSHVRTVDQPVLLVHGDADGTVGVIESLEFYIGLRFNGKNGILLNYPGEGHGLANLANRKDLTIRLQQFFDHHLLGSEAPEWMVEGVPFLDKAHGAWRR